MKLPLWGRKRREDELNEEIQAHLTLAEREEMESGRAKKDAQTVARREFGNVTLAEETTRDMWGGRWLSDLLQDVRYGLRMLRLNPGFTAIALLTLALGIGANTAIFSLIDAVMLRRLPVQKPEELLVIARNSSSKRFSLAQYFTNPIWEQIRDRQDVFSGIFAWSPKRFDMAQGGESHNVNALYVSGDFFHTLGVSPAAGRLLTTRDDIRGCPGTAVLSYGFWQGHYGGATSAVGSVISLDRQTFQVIGVTAPGFSGLEVGKTFDVAVPVCTEAIIDGKDSMLDGHYSLWLNIMGRSKPNISLHQVTAYLQVLWPSVLAAAAPSDWGLSGLDKEFVGKTLIADLSPGGISYFREQYDQPLKTLMAVVALVLLIACANIAGLMLARAASRRKEIAVRLALGASRFRLIRQLLTECILLSCAGAMLGVLFARWGCALLVRFISSDKNPVFLQLSLDSRILFFTAVIAVTTGLLFGVLPAFRSTQLSLAAAMKGNQTSDVQNHSHFRSGRWIVASQVALSLVLIIAAGLFLKSFHKLLTLDAGFDRNNVLIVSVNEDSTNVAKDQHAILRQQILERLATLPGVISVSGSVVTPLTGGGLKDDFYLDSDNGPTGDDARAAINYVSKGYFATLRTPFRDGRDFDERDGNQAPLVSIINETMSRKFFPHSNPIGKYVHIGESAAKEKTPPIQIIGVVKDAKYSSLHSTIPSAIYFPITQSPPLFSIGEFMIRTAFRPSSLVRAAEETIVGVNKNISLGFDTLEKQVDDSVRQDELLATLSGFFGGLALLLATIGLYGVLAYMVTQRRKEIGIRMALGAGRESILWLILRDVLIFLLAGCSVGVIVSWWATQFLQKMLFELQARDMKTIMESVAVLVAVALFAGYLPARRASRLNPMAILRDE